MLKELRRSEERFEDCSKIAYLLQVGFHADSVICKMCSFGIREIETTEPICVLRSENKSLSSSRTFFFFNITASLTFLP